MGGGVDFAAEGLLDGLDADARAARAELLEELAADGVTLDELRRAVGEKRLALLPAERVLGGVPRYSTRDLAAATGFEIAVLEGTRRSGGLPVPDPDEPVHSDLDLASARRLRAVVDSGVPLEPVLDVNRVMGRAMAQVAAAARQLVGGTFIEPGLNELEVARRYLAAAQQLGPTVAPTLEHLFALHLRELLRMDAARAAGLDDAPIAGARNLTVGFADLVGFTRLGGSVPAEELGRVARRLEALAEEHVRRPVRVVKSIGDAVLLLSPDPGALLDAALALVDAAAAVGEDFPELRAGVATGEVLERDGDVYGHPVNVASRITAVARAGSVLVDPSTRDAAGDERFAWSFAGARRLKGVPDELRLYRARKAPPPPDA